MADSQSLKGIGCGLAGASAAEAAKAASAPSANLGVTPMEASKRPAAASDLREWGALERVLEDRPEDVARDCQLTAWAVARALGRRWERVQDLFKKGDPRRGIAPIGRPDENGVWWAHLADVERALGTAKVDPSAALKSHAVSQSQARAARLRSEIEAAKNAQER